MDSPGKKNRCKNSTYGCTFASSSVVDMVKHFQRDSTFHPVRCLERDKAVIKTNFTKHYAQFCEDSSASPCPKPEEAPDVGEAKANTTVSQELHFLRVCVTECALGVERLSDLMKNVAGDVAEVKVMKEQDMEAIVKGQGDVIEKLDKSIMMIAEKMDKVQEDVGGLVKRLEKDAESIVQRVEKVDGSVFKLEKDVGTMVQRVENVDGLVKECAKDNKLGVDMLSRAMRDVAADVAEVNVIKEKQQDVETIIKQQGDWIKDLRKCIMMTADKVNKVEQDVGTIVQGVEKVDGLVKEVRVLTHPLADQSKIHWYVENVSHYIEKAKTKRSYVVSDVFVIRGYSARLCFEVEKDNGDLCIALFLLFCRGPNDSLLQWPFGIPYTLSLVHPKDASNSKEEKITPSSTDPECFEKPKKEENTAYGTNSLCTVEEAQKEGFIENDAVCVSVTLHE